jgi:hypothetical protein
MSNILLVPIHLDALVLDHDELVVDSTADFSRLPYRTEKRDINPDVANISEDIVSMPFENHLLLEAGIHLHWSLPDALTRARPKPGSPEIQEFPSVPNRWLVTRCNADDRVEKEWIIESDYLNPPANASGIQTGVAIPYHQGEGQPFRYLGRKVDLSDAAQSATREQGAYYPTLTAVGYGEPTFAAFYPNCYSVFGFFEKFTGNIAGRRYYLTGWYSNPAKDVLKTHVNSLRALEEDFKWTITPTGQEFPSRIVCYARLDVDRAKLSQPNELGTIAVGNTGTEALSACMAKRLSEKQQAPTAAGGDDLKAVYEDQFEAMHLVSRLEHRQLDVAPKLFEARHEQGFTAVTGGTLWTVRPESTANSAAQADDAPAGIALPDGLGHLLNVVNEQQAKYDRAWQEIESLRVQLFSDWYKYMLCAYPPNDLGDAYPDIDDVALYIEGHSDENLDKNFASVASLKRKIAYAGTLELSENNGKILADKAKGKLGGALAEAINALQAFINALEALIDDEQRKKASKYRLKQVSGPRYWRPTEPAILIEGPVAKPSLRHGQDGRPSDGLLEADLLTNVDAADPSRNDLRPKIREKIAEIGRTRKNFAFTKWEGQPWNPFLLEWQVEVFPIEHHSNIDPATGRYQEDFIVANYDLAENKVDLSLKRDKGATTKAANMYSGRSILTPHAIAQLTQQINTYIFKEVFPLYYSAQGSKAKGLKAKAAPMSRWGKDDLFKQIEEVEKWYMRDEKSPLLKVQKPHEDTGLTAFRGRQELPATKSLSQSLGGFNDALLMHKQTPQLRVEDPLGFSDYQKFGERVKDVVNNSIYSAPEPLNDFNPIRSGTMKIHQLRLVDTFGQVKKLDVKKLVTSQPLTASDGTLVSLPPRLVQPARVNFRWLAADRNEQEMNDHPATTPICGWVLANHLDDSVMIYDNRGKALGSLVKKYEGSGPVVVWLPAPGGGGVSAVRDIANPHLKKMVETTQRWGAVFLDDFIAAIDSAVKNIEPENFAQHQDLALLMGRPLALVRASVNLEIKGLTASHHGWNEFRQNLNSKTRDDNGFSRVRFPIRIGEYRQFNDGTVGYWREKENGYEDETFFAPQSDEDVKVKSTHLKTHKTHSDAMVFYQTVEAQPQILSLLIDPRGSVHATTGILPVKGINIPPDQYAAALQAIEITFLSTPILTDAGKIHLPLPDEAGYQWSWLQQDVGGTWSEVSSRGLVRKEDFSVFATAAADVWNELTQLEWIKVIDQKDPARASVTAKDERKSQSLDRHKDKTAKIEDILDRAHIGPVNLAAKFSGSQEIREGWLKLSAAQDVQRKP